MKDPGSIPRRILSSLAARWAALAVMPIDSLPTRCLHERLPLLREVGLAVMQSIPLAWSKYAIEKKGALRLASACVKHVPTPLAIITLLQASERPRARLPVPGGICRFCDARGSRLRQGLSRPRE